MAHEKTLRRELLTAFGVVFASALIVAVASVVLIFLFVDDPAEATLYILALLLLDITIFTLFGRWLIQHRILSPLEGLVTAVEDIAAGGLDRKVEPQEKAELKRVADAVNVMAARLIEEQSALSDNIQSLEDTNRQLTDARNELIHAEKLASVGRLAAGVAHEIGNPLAGIMGYLDVLARRDPGENQELITAASGEARRIDRIVHGLLDFARPREVTPRAIDVDHVVREAVGLLTAQGKLDDVEVSTGFGAGTPTVFADPYRLQQVIVNLLLNAVDAMEDAAERNLWVTTSPRRLEVQRRFPARRAGDPPGIDYSHRRRFHQRPKLPREPSFKDNLAVAISIRDSGTGIDPDLLSDLFEPFVTTKEPGKGTGLGLAVAARLIDAMGGTIKIESELDQGSTFTILLPPANKAEPVQTDS